MAGCGAVGSAQRLGRWGRRFKSCHPDHYLGIQGLAQLVARTPGGREVASSSLVSLTNFQYVWVWRSLVARSVRDAEVINRVWRSW